MTRVSRRRNLAAAAAAALTIAALPVAATAAPTQSFSPLASWNVPDGGVAEIVSATADGRTLLYTNAGDGLLGFVDISDPAAPADLGAIDVGGEPTSVSVMATGKAVVVVRTDELEEGQAPVIRPGKLLVVDVATRTIETTIPIGHHPDSVATGVRNGTPFAVVAIENEPVVVDGDGKLTDADEPGDPGDVSGPGTLQVVDLATGTVHDVPLALPAAFPFADDPQPEFVDLRGTRAVISLQENNAYALLDVGKALDGTGAEAVTRVFSAGTAADRPADLQSDGRIDFSERYPADVASEDHAGLRFPDGVAFSPDGKWILSADEGEFDFTGGRGWSIHKVGGGLAWQDGGRLEREAVRHGQYPEERSDAKGIEIEGMEVGTFGGRSFAFVGSERGSFLAVYRLREGRSPEFVQILPTGVGPEGILAIPSRGLVVTSNEETGDLTLMKGVPYLHTGTDSRPLLQSDGVRVPWSAVSGLAGDRRDRKVIWAVPDSALPSEIYKIDLRSRPARVTAPYDVTKGGVQQSYDLEGIVVDRSIRAPRRDAGFWLAQEGNAAFGQPGYRPNLLIQVDARGRVLDEVPLPAGIDSPAGGVIRGNGFEGLTLSHDGRYVLAAVQRQFTGEPAVGGRLHTRIARYDLTTGTWDFFLYPLDGPVNEGWVGLSEIVTLGPDRYAVIERDQQVGGAAQVKRLYEFGLAGLTPTDGTPLAAGTQPADVAGKVVQKLLYRDVVEEFGPFEKLEGLTVTRDRQVWGNIDNDGGLHESRLLRLGAVQAPPTFQLTVLHNNDGESDLLPSTDKGSVAQFATLVEQAKAAAADGPSSLRRSEILVASGDNSLPGKIVNASLQRGVPFYDAKAMDLMGFDAFVIGNHDFDLGPEYLADFVRSFERPSLGEPPTALPPFLSANLDFSGEPELAALEDEGRIAKSVVIRLGGEKVGLVSATTPTLPFISSPRNVAVDPDVLGAIEDEVARLKRRGINKIIVASHLQGIQEDVELAAQLRDVDLLIAGGGDELLADPDDTLLPGDTADPAFPYPLLVKDATGRTVPIVTTAGNYKYLGRLVVRFDGAGRLTEVVDTSGPLANPPAGAPGELAPDPEVQAEVVEPVAAAVAAIDAEVVAQSAVALDGVRNSVRGKETNLGNLIADATLAKARELGPAAGIPTVHVAVQNGGGIRNNSVIPAGDITEGLTFDILPFGNTVAVVKDMTPAEVKALMENSVAFIARQPGGALLPAGDGTGRFSQIAGFTLTYDADAQPRTYDVAGNLVNAGARVIDVTLADGTEIVEDGVPVAGAPSVNVAMPDFNARGGDQFPTAGKEIELLGITGQVAFAEYLADLGAPVGSDGAGSPYAPGVNQRIFEDGAPTP